MKKIQNDLVAEVWSHHLLTVMFFSRNLQALCLDLQNVGIVHCEKVAPLFQIAIHQRIAMSLLPSLI